MDMPLPTRDEVAQQIFDAALSRARRHGLSFGEGADSDLRSMAQAAASTILTAAAAKSPDVAEAYVSGAVRVASEGMTAFVDEMVVGRMRIPGYLDTHRNVIGEETFRWARNVLCPLWPIC
jgi:hypothetical protein